VKLGMVALNVNTPMQIAIEFYSATFCAIPRALLVLQLKGWGDFCMLQGVYATLRLLVFCGILTRDFQRSLPAALRTPAQPCAHYFGTADVEAPALFIGIPSMCMGGRCGVVQRKPSWRPCSE
jgi:hypothetical protein